MAETNNILALHMSRRSTQRCGYVRGNEENVLAIGQKAAWFTGTRHFVNLVEGAGLYGFDGIRRSGRIDDRSLAERKRSGRSDHPERMGVRKLHMKRSYKIIPIYTADVSGVCSALYELGRDDSDA